MTQFNKAPEEPKRVPLLWTWDYDNGRDNPECPAVLAYNENCYYLLPQLVGKKRLTPNQALKRYEETKEIVGEFRTPGDAAYYYKLLIAMDAAQPPKIGG